MFNKLVFCLCFSFLSSFVCQAQQCALSVKGQVVDEATKKPLSFVNVVIQDLTVGSLTDEKGLFNFEHICPGSYHFILSHIGCDPVEKHVEITSDTILTIGLSHTSKSLNGVVIHGMAEDLSAPSESISRQLIEDNANQSLSELLSQQSGVSTLKNGGGISKPIVQGLYGNRLVILNNGIEQGGQQWGNDHSPEIDPFAADKVIILKGTDALAFGNNLGSVILVEPKKIAKEPHLHGQFNYLFETNGRGNTLQGRIAKYSPALAWRVSGSLKKVGDRKAANYFLNNTGFEEANLSMQLEKSWQERLHTELYISSFNSTLGILRGAHIGNLTDLNEALSRPIPFFTDSAFSYTIEAPKQQVAHHLVKQKTKWLIDNKKSLEIVLAGQLNNRKEFDVRRGGRTSKPALDLQQYTLSSFLQYSQTFHHNAKLVVGNQHKITDNTNLPTTGILPLIPDYLNWSNGSFATYTQPFGRLVTKTGLRLDIEHQEIVAISASIPRSIERYSNQFYNLGAILSLKYAISETQELGFNIGLATRNPAINERYSNGLHQGVSGIEEGNVTLDVERLFKNTLEYKWIPNAHFSFNALAYHQQFSNYIFLNPQDETRLTIRGAFPVFQYEQTDANIHGIDLSTKFMLGRSLLGSLQYSYIKGTDIEQDIPLVYMPPTNVRGHLTYRSRKTIQVSPTFKLEDVELEVGNSFVFEQKNWQVGQEIIAPPASYHLVDLKLSTNLILPSNKIRYFIKVDNLFNVAYRDYLNRLRYFADDIGINWTTGLNIKF